MSNHFKTLKNTLSQLPRDMIILEKLKNIENSFIYNRDSEMLKNDDDGMVSLEKSEQVIHSPLDKKYNLFSAIFYAINTDQYLLINNHELFWDNLLSKMIIDLDERNIYKDCNYKTFVRKKALNELLSTHEVNNYFVLRYLADFLNINIVATTENLIYSAKSQYDYTVGTVVLKIKNKQISTNNCIYKNSIYDELVQKYDAKFKKFNHIILGNINKYKLTDLVKLCEDYDIPHAKSKKCELYNKLVEYFDIFKK